MDYLSTDKVLVIDLAASTVTETSLDEALVSEKIGGAGITRHLYDQYQGDDPVVIGTGLLTGTTCPASAAGVITAKSPVTGKICHCPVTYKVGIEIKFSGYDYIGDPAQAVRCPLWEQCRRANQGPRSMRQIFVSDYREQVLAARQYNQTEEFTQNMKLRPMVERIIFELTHYNDARECRRVGLANADWQARMAATAYNLKHWIRLSDRRYLNARA